jgi:hypothetical protein
MTKTELHRLVTGAFYLRPVGRGIVLEDDEARPHVDEWIEKALATASRSSD